MAKSRTQKLGKARMKVACATLILPPHMHAFDTIFNYTIPYCFGALTYLVCRMDDTQQMNQGCIINKATVCQTPALVAVETRFAVNEEGGCRKRKDGLTGWGSWVPPRLIGSCLTPPQSSSVISSSNPSPPCLKNKTMKHFILVCVRK